MGLLFGVARFIRVGGCGIGFFLAFGTCSGFSIVVGFRWVYYRVW